MIYESLVGVDSLVSGVYSAINTYKQVDRLIWEKMSYKYIGMRNLASNKFLKSAFIWFVLENPRRSRNKRCPKIRGLDRQLKAAMRYGIIS